jgi:hypothetical protein
LIGLGLLSEDMFNFYEKNEDVHRLASSQVGYAVISSLYGS